MGFEPTRACTLPLFESGTFDHSDISPWRSIAYLMRCDNSLDTHFFCLSSTTNIFQKRPNHFSKLLHFHKTYAIIKRSDYACVAQWQSNRLLTDRLEVRLLSQAFFVALFDFPIAILPADTPRRIYSSLMPLAYIIEGWIIVSAQYFVSEESARL